MTFTRLAVAALVVSAASLSAQTPAPTAAQVPTFRSAATLVPVDVRVLDAAGNPINDLTQADFTVRENGKVQTITLFNQHTLSATAVTPGDPVFRRVADSATYEPQNQRIFLLMLGRGRLQPPAKGVDAALQFVRERLLPQDVVAVMAWNRATDFTTDRAQIVDVLERFKDGHEKIELQLALWFSGLRAAFGSPDIPPSLQKQIDAVFASDGRARDIPSAPFPNQRNVVDTMNRNSADLLRAELSAAPANPLASVAPQAGAMGMSFDEYVTSNKQTIQDVTNIYTGIEYLRYIDGEKHLVFVTEDAFMMPSGDDDVAVAAVANDARVAIDTIHTGGLSGSISASAGFNQMFKVGSLKAISDLTGGVSSAFQYASSAVDRIDRSTRSSYLLGYNPQNQKLDGQYRKVTVEVNRPGAQVLYRHGYYGRDALAPLDRGEALSYSRITAAGAVERRIRDLDLDLYASPYLEGGGRGVSIRLTVSPERVKFALVNGRHVAELHIAIFCGLRNGNIVGERWRQVELSLPDDKYEQFMKKGTEIEMRVPVVSLPTHVKAIVYDPNADLLGSITEQIRATGGVIR